MAAQLRRNPFIVLLSWRLWFKMKRPAIFASRLVKHLVKAGNLLF